jgi:hypothetical protein
MPPSFLHAVAEAVGGRNVSVAELHRLAIDAARRAREGARVAPSVVRATPLTLISGPEWPGLSVRKRRLPDAHGAKPRGAPDFHR